VANNQHTITDERQQDVSALLLERISLRGISRSMRVSMTWLMAYASIVWDETPQDLGANVEWLDKLTDKQLQSIELQIDEMWSFVDFKKNKKWIWVVYCPATKQVLAMHFGRRAKADLEVILVQLPDRLRCNCQFATDHFESYYQLIPPDQHKPSKAYFTEGYFAGVRARVSRLVRKALSFSKDLDNHVAAIRYFVWQRNLDSYP
jgi:insertion element IS1 protein InsB